MNERISVMPKVLFTITYGIKPQMRERYLGLIQDLRNQVRNVGGKQYSVFETKGKKNHFTEMFWTQSLEEYEALEDNQDETTQELVRKLEECVEDGGMKYTTLIELE